MKTKLLSIFVALLVIGGSCGASAVSKAAVATNDQTDYFYDAEFVMESGVRMTKDAELSYHGFMLRSNFEKIKEKYTNISFGTIVYPTYYETQYGKVTEESVFGPEAIYTIDPEVTGKITLGVGDTKADIKNHNVEVTGNYLVSLYGAEDEEYTGVSYMKAKLYGADVYRLATLNNNSMSLISACENTVDNIFIDKDIKDTAKAVIDAYTLKGNKFDYTIETYVSNILVETKTENATYGTLVTAPTPLIPDTIFLPSRSTTSDYVRCNNKTTLKLYYAANPTYEISYYAMDADANYQLVKKITDLKSAYFEIISLTDEQKKLPSDVVLPVEGYKDDYIFAPEDSVTSGVNDGNLILKVCYKVSTRICSYMKKTNGAYKLTKMLSNDVPYGYLMCGTFTKTAVISVTVPKSLINYGGLQPTGGITFTNGTTLPNDKQGIRKAGAWVAMDIGLHVKGLKTSNNIDQHAYGRCAEITDAAQCKALYYDKTVDVATNPVFINDKDRDLTVVLYNDVFYVYIDDQFVTTFLPEGSGFFMPRDESNQDPRFHKGDSYMFGIFMGANASSSLEIKSVDELYNADALQEITTNPRYSNIVVE